jgi:hypothetical protein
MMGVTKSIVFACLAGVLVFAGRGVACQLPLLDEILDKPLGSLAASGQSLVRLGPCCHSTLAAILVENAGFANTNKFGIYDPADPSHKLELFAGGDEAGDSVTVQFDRTHRQAWVDSAHKVSMGSAFGFYLDSTARSCNGGGFFYSDEQLNTGADHGVEHALIFDTRGVRGLISGKPDVVIGFEDLRYDSTNYKYDGDFDDMVVGMKCVTPVPEPATIMLLGIGCLSLVSRRKNKPESAR